MSLMDGFDPAVLAKSHIGKFGSVYMRRALKNKEMRPTEDELIRISGQLFSALSSDEDLEIGLRTQSALIHEAFTTLLLKATQYESFCEDTFMSALLAQKQYRMICQTLAAMSNAKNKKAKERTDMTRRKSGLAPDYRDVLAHLPQGL